MTTTPNARRQSAGRVNGLRRWNPAADEVMAHDIDALCTIGRRLGRPLTTTEAARVLDALGLGRATVRATVADVAS